MSVIRIDLHRGAVPGIDTEPKIETIYNQEFREDVTLTGIIIYVDDVPRGMAGGPDTPLQEASGEPSVGLWQITEESKGETP